MEIAGTFLVIGSVLFFAAGTMLWLAGWTFLALFFGFTIALTGWLLRYDPSLLNERMTGFAKPDRKAWDTAFFAVAQILFLAWIVLMPLDAVRFRWSEMPGWLHAVGSLMLLGSFYGFFLTFRENSFLSPVVRVQSDRGQTVVSTGPYRVVRHPMYASAIAFFAGTALLLGSWWGLAFALLIVVAIAYRALREERTLRAELPGYGAYLERVKYHLIPYVW